MAVNTEKTDNAEKDIAVEKDVHAEKAISQTVQKLIDYAVLTDLIGWNDRIWSYNLVLDLIGAEGPAPDETRMAGIWGNLRMHLIWKICWRFSHARPS